MEHLQPSSARNGATSIKSGANSPSYGWGSGGTGPAPSIVHELTTRPQYGRFGVGTLHSREMNSKIMLEHAGYAVLLLKITQR